MTTADAALEVSDLRIDFGAGPVVDGVGLNVRPGEIHGIIGESGSGKSSVGLAALRMLPGGGRVTGGAVLLRGKDIATLSEAELRQVRGNRIGMVFQDPMSSLNPMLSIGRQLDEALRAHGRTPVAQRRTRALELLALVGIPDPPRRIKERPHRFSGGQRQRVMIALALAGEPAVLIADEPTTALDATTAVGVLDLLERIAVELRTAVVLISHDIAVVARICHRVTVMSAGRVVEHGPAEEVLTRPRDPYTRSLLAAVPRLDAPAPVRPSTLDDEGGSLLEITGLAKHYPVRRRLRRGTISGLDGIDLTLAHGETLGIVGESGSGKSTLARIVAGADDPTAGTVRFDGEELRVHRSQRLRAAIQLVFQDPYSSLHPRMPIGTALAEPLLAHGMRDRRRREERVAELLTGVGLDPAAAHRRPGEFSGGQRQRIGIARALATEPKLLICDEPVSSLDVSVQAQILALLADLRDRLGLSMLFISHDLAVVRQVSDRIAVLHAGSLVELGPADAVITAPRHPYTASLLAATGSPDPRAERRTPATNTDFAGGTGSAELVEHAPGHWAARNLPDGTGRGNG